MINFIEIHGDVWLASEIIMIGVYEPKDEDEFWGVTIRVAGVHADFEYSFDSENEAKNKHIELVKMWKKALTQ